MSVSVVWQLGGGEWFHARITRINNAESNQFAFKLQLSYYIYFKSSEFVDSRLSAQKPCLLKLFTEALQIIVEVLNASSLIKVVKVQTYLRNV